MVLPERETLQASPLCRYGCPGEYLSRSQTIFPSFSSSSATCRLERFPGRRQDDGAVEAKNHQHDGREVEVGKRLLFHERFHCFINSFTIVPETSKAVPCRIPFGITGRDFWADQAIRSFEDA